VNPSSSSSETDDRRSRCSASSDPQATSSLDRSLCSRSSTSSITKPSTLGLRSSDLACSASSCSTCRSARRYITSFGATPPSFCQNAFHKVSSLLVWSIESSNSRGLQAGEQRLTRHRCHRGQPSEGCVSSNAKRLLAGDQPLPDLHPLVEGQPSNTSSATLASPALRRWRRSAGRDAPSPALWWPVAGSDRRSAGRHPRLQSFIRLRLHRLDAIPNLCQTAHRHPCPADREPGLRISP
jgi:hypothetical protein